MYTHAHFVIHYFAIPNASTLVLPSESRAYRSLDPAGMAFNFISTNEVGVNT